MGKRYYWLKLHEDFFDDETIQFIEEQPNGEKYVLFLLKLYCKATRTKGILIRCIGDNLFPYDVKALAKYTNTDPSVVQTAINLFQSLKLVKIQETGEIYMEHMDEMVGSETDGARRMRKARANDKKLEQIEIPQLDFDEEIKEEAEEIVITLPLNSGERNVTKKEIDEWQELYPNVDVQQQLRSMLGWLNANPQRRKTKSGINRFINAWLSKEQDKPRATVPFKSYKAEKPLPDYLTERPPEDEKNASSEDLEKIRKTLEELRKRA